MQPDELTRVIGVAVYNTGLCFFIPTCLWAWGKLPGDWPRVERWRRNLFMLARPPFMLWIWCAFGALVFEALETETEDLEHERYVEVLMRVKALDEQLYWDLLNVTGLPPADLELWRNWDFFGSVFYCFSLCSTIGYGEFNPKTDAGKVATIVYTVFGIPVFAYLFNAFAQACLQILGGHAVELVERRVDVVLKQEAPADGKYTLGELRQVFGKAKLGLSDAVLDHMFKDVGHHAHTLDQVQFARLVRHVKCWGRRSIEFRVAASIFFAFFTVIPFYWNMGSYLDGLYFAIISYFTVGLGDMIPHTGDSSSWRAAPYLSKWADFNGMPVMLLGVGVSLGIILIKTAAALGAINIASYGALVGEEFIKLTGQFGSQKFKRKSVKTADSTATSSPDSEKTADTVSRVEAFTPLSSLPAKNGIPEIQEA